MRKLSRRLAALALTMGVAATSAFALTPEQLGQLLKDHYAGEIPQQVWNETTVEGMMDALGDRFSHYLTREEYAAFLAGVNETDGQAVPTTVTLEDGHIGRVSLNTFGEGTYEALKTGVESLDAQADRWIVDLRQNTGGELNAAAESVSAFVGGGSVIYLKDKEGKLYSAKGEAALTMDPVILLVGSKTASAGELFAAAVRDRKAGVVIGSRTYGKGVAQNLYNQDTNADYFADGSALLLTTSFAYSDGMLNHNAMGVLPHLMVEKGMEESVAKLLCSQAPKGDNKGTVRIHLGQWRWYVTEDDARANTAAFAELMEALPPQVEIFYGNGTGWTSSTPAAIAAAWGATGYEAREFSDVENSQYKDAINALKTYGILKGDQYGNFQPNASLDRATLCALLAQAMNYPKSTAAPAFADTPADAWYTPYVTTLSSMGIINGYSDGLFHPNDPIPHQQFMAILSRIAAATSLSAESALKTGPQEEDLASGDFDRYDPWAVSGAWLLDGGWHKDAKDIDPQAATTREEAGYDLWSMLSIMGIIPG